MGIGMLTSECGLCGRKEKKTYMERVDFLGRNILVDSKCRLLVNEYNRVYEAPGAGPSLPDIFYRLFEV